MIKKFKVTLVSSAAIKSTLARVSIALGEKSLRFPIGVPTTYNIPLIYHIRRHTTHKCQAFRV